MLGSTMTPPATPNPRHKKRKTSRWTWLLVLPYLGLCFPQLYARATPTLWGFPFFYWYQFAWVILASLLMAFVYRRHTKNDPQAE
jgi:Na+-driven multidrug efflux pump